MKRPLLLLALLTGSAFAAPLLAQAPKSPEKKAPAPKTPADLAFDEFNKVRSEAAGKPDYTRFQKVIAAGIAYLTTHPTHGRVNDAIRDLAFFGSTLDRAQAAQRVSYASALKLEVTNYRYKDGLSDPAKLVIAALDAAVADFDVREQFNADNVNTLREKIDTLAQMPGSGKFLVERERSYAQVLLALGSAARGEAHLRKLLEGQDKALAAMAREELNIVEAKKEPFALKFTALDGREVDFAQLRGKVVALYFWSATNKGSLDRIEALKQTSGDFKKRGLEVVTVSLDKSEDRDKVEKAIKENRITWPVHFDGQGTKNAFAPKLNVTGAPRLYVFDQKGILQTVLVGAPVARISPDVPQNQVEPLVKKLLGVK